MATSSAINNTAIQNLMGLNVSSLGSNSTEVTSAYLSKLAEIGSTLSSTSSSSDSLIAQATGGSQLTSMSGASSFLSSLASGTSSSATGSYLSAADKADDAAVSNCLSTMNMSQLYGSSNMSDLQSSVSMLMSGTTQTGTFDTTVAGSTVATGNPVVSTGNANESQGVKCDTTVSLPAEITNTASRTSGIDPYSIASTYTCGSTATNFEGFAAGTSQYSAAVTSNGNYADALANANTMYQTGDFSGLYANNANNTTNSALSSVKDAYTNFMTSYMESMGIDSAEVQNVLNFYTPSFDAYTSALTGYNSDFASSVGSSFQTSVNTSYQSFADLTSGDSAHESAETNL